MLFQCLACLSEWVCSSFARGTTDLFVLEYKVHQFKDFGKAPMDSARFGYKLARHTVHLTSAGKLTRGHWYIARANFSDKDLGILYPSDKMDEVKGFFDEQKPGEEPSSSTGQGVKIVKKAAKFVIKKLVKHALAEILLPGFNEALLVSNALELLLVSEDIKPNHKCNSQFLLQEMDLNKLISKENLIIMKDFLSFAANLCLHIQSVMLGNMHIEKGSNLSSASPEITLWKFSKTAVKDMLRPGTGYLMEPQDAISAVQVRKLAYAILKRHSNIIMPAVNTMKLSFESSCNFDTDCCNSF